MKLSRKDLTSKSACAEGLDFFDAHWPSGKADIQEVADALAADGLEDHFKFIIKNTEVVASTLSTEALTGADVYIAGDLVARSVNITGTLIVRGALKVTGDLSAQKVDAYGAVEIGGDASVVWAIRSGGHINIGGASCLTSPNHPELQLAQ